MASFKNRLEINPINITLPKRQRRSSLGVSVSQGTSAGLRWSVESVGFMSDTVYLLPLFLNWALIPRSFLGRCNAHDLWIR